MEIFRQMQINLVRRKQLKEYKIPCDLHDPLNFYQFIYIKILKVYKD